MMTLDQFGHDQFHSDDRVFVFKPAEGKKQLSSTGIVDPKLFTGDNKLVASKEEDTNLWVLKYTDGIVPPVFKQRFTSFSAAMKFAKNYFNKRGFQITEVIDAPKNSQYQRLG
jgi:hypothetical protein